MSGYCVQKSLETVSIKKCRIISRIDVKSNNVVKGVQFEGLRVVGKPDEIVDTYVKQGCDEIFYIDTVASLYERNNLTDIVSLAAEKANIPITVEGGVRSIEDIRLLLQAGADKVAINTYAIKNPSFLKLASEVFGSQCIVLSITAKKNFEGQWIAWTDNARETTEVDAIEWAKSAEKLGAGEVIVTSIDCDGRMKGMDVALYQKLKSVNIPLIASGGVGNSSHIEELYKNANIDGVSIASSLHYKKENIKSLKSSLSNFGLTVRSNNYSVLDKKISSNNKIHIINSQTSNIFSLVNSIRQIGSIPIICNRPEDLIGAVKIIIPGVGSFGSGISMLKDSGLYDAIIQSHQDGAHIFGICLGAQMLFEKGYESGEDIGLGILQGEVIVIQDKPEDRIRIPHIGWSSLNVNEKFVGLDSAHTIAQGLDKEEYYFLHSYMMQPNNPRSVMATVDYCNVKIPAIIYEDHVFACQFHPEKSGSTGFMLLAMFCNY